MAEPFLLTEKTEKCLNEWPEVQALPCDLAVEVPVPAFEVSALLALKKEAVIKTGWPQGSDIPVKVNGELVAWGEFEVVAGKLAVRITELD